jgi:lariat debranching enzyme
MKLLITCGNCEWPRPAVLIDNLIEVRYHGGWLAPNIYYLGGSGCVRLNGIRIAGASGIFKGHDYNLGHYERIPYDNASLRSVYHVRSHDVVKLSLLNPGPEIFISHDWPEGIYRYGDAAALINQKPFFKPDIEKGELGNPHMMDVMKLLKPTWWFAAHLHVRFQAEYDHTGHGVSDWGRTKLGRSKPPVNIRGAPVKNNDEIVMDEDEDEVGSTAIKSPLRPAPNADEIVMDDDDGDEASPMIPPPNAAEESVKVPLDQSLVEAEPRQGETPTKPDLPEGAPLENPDTSEKSLPSTTKFLALDKCVPRRKFLEVDYTPNHSHSTNVLPKIVDVPSPQNHSPPRFTYDTEWLAISKAMHPLLSIEKRTNIQPRLTLARRWVEREFEWVKEKIAMIKRAASTKADAAEEKKAEEDDGELEVEKFQQFVMTASGPNVNINPRQHRELVP